jgi:hypothetical protein
MGRVYRAYEKSLERYVAVKVLDPELARDPAIAARFLGEARAAANLNHPNVVHVYNAGQQDGAFYFVMELVEGAHIEALLSQQGPLNVREAVGFIRQAAAGLEHAHQHGLIHGDVKPANFIVSNTGVVKVTDFGLARRVKAGTGKVEAETFGTPGYVSPEVIQGLTPDHRSDIYSLGCTLYHMLAGRPPFVGATTAATLDQHIHLPPPVLQQFNTKVPPILSQVVARMLAKQPGDRYQTYAELRQALDRFLGDRPLAPLPVPHPPRETRRRPPGPLPAPRTPTERVPAPPPKKESVLGIVFTLISVFACGLIVVLIYKMQFAGQRLEPGITNVVIRPVRPPPAAQTLEQQAEQELAALKTDVAEALAEGQLGRAYELCGQWPAQRFAGTAAARAVADERARILEQARQQWHDARQQIETLRAANELAEALAICDRLARHSAGIPELSASITETHRQLAEAKREFETQRLFENEVAAQARAAKLVVVATQAAAQITGFQWDKGRQDLNALLEEASHDAEMLAALQAQAAEFDGLLALRNGVAGRLKTKPVGPLVLATRRGEVQGEVTAVDADRVHLRQNFGAAGFAETAVLWTDLTPASACRLFVTALNPQQPEELFGYAILITRFALAKQARIEDARKTLQALAQRDPARAAVVEKYLIQLNELEASQLKVAAQRQAESDAAMIWQQLQQAIPQNQWDKVAAALQLLQADYADTDFVKSRAAEIQQAAKIVAERAAPKGFVPLDIHAACNTEFILDTPGQQIERGMEGRNTYAREGYYREGASKGLPATGRVAVPGAEPGGFFQLQTAAGSDAIALTWEGGRFPNTAVCEFPAAQQRKYSQLALLVASSVRRGTVRLAVQYETGPPDTAALKVPDWSGERAGENAVVAVTSTPSDDATRKVQLFVQTVEIDPTRRVTGLNFAWVSAATESPHHCVAIFAVSGLPVESK